MLEQDNKELALIAQKEIDTNTQVEELWHKALALTDDKEKAVKRYIKLRIRQLQKESPKKPSKKVEPIVEVEKPRKKVVVKKEENKVQKNTNENKKGVHILLSIAFFGMLVLGLYLYNKSVKKSYNVMGEENYERTNIPQAKKTKTLDDYIRSCSQGNKSDCKKEVKIYTEACLYNDALRCRNLGYMYENGKGVVLNYTEALKYYEKSCSLGNEGGCRNIKILNRKIKHILKSTKANKQKQVNYSNRKNSNIPDTVVQSYQNQKNTQKESIKKYSLTINTVPSDARVRIMNIKPKYYDGIRLVKGKYKIRVSRKGYERQEGIVDLSRSSVYSVTLKKISKTTISGNRIDMNTKTMNKRETDNLKTCMNGAYASLCKHSWLTASQAKQVKKAERRDNLKTCMNGAYASLCKHSWLTASQVKQVKKAERRAKLNRGY